MTGVELIAQERKRQIEVEGFTLEKDKFNYHGENLAMAAACYVTPEFQRIRIGGKNIPYNFPFEQKWWKPTPDDRVRELVKAGALIAAEIDRLKNQ